MTWFKNKTFYLFIVLLVHVTLLDLFFVTHNGVVFLVNKNLEIKTIITHLLIVFISVGFYFFLNSGLGVYRNIQAKVSNLAWLISSLLLTLVIAFVLI